MDTFTLCNNCINKCKQCGIENDCELYQNVFCNKCPDKGKKELAKEILNNDVLYTVSWVDLYDDHIHEVAYFRNKELAEKYIEIQKQIDTDYEYWINEKKFNDCDVNLEDEVVPYYEYFLYLCEPLEYADNFDFTEKVNRIYDKDLAFEVDKDMVYAWSVNSLEEAKELAIKLYEENKVC